MKKLPGLLYLKDITHPDIIAQTGNNIQPAGCKLGNKWFFGKTSIHDHNPSDFFEPFPLSNERYGPKNQTGFPP
ncbi:hypothetical protein D0T49_05335 [Paludibacter sp. 221]|uniref:hypothetical protein n=1 Tax=Paludibacter sp. 221 TaxID=2302939 RepID=UPI0013D164B2|nr:hypothetical protein [Paludibacter sp. 221]NDV46463.1 hypothetical protein [Paludibacter sp. 221]